MDFHRIKIIFRVGDEIASGTIVSQLTPRRLIVRPVEGEHGLDCEQTYKIILARTNAVARNALADGVGTFLVNPEWTYFEDGDHHPFPSEYVYKFDDAHVWTLAGHRHKWQDVRPIFIDDA